MVALVKGLLEPLNHGNVKRSALRSIARLAYAEFGKGIHPAGLNFGDCFAYALAKHTGHPLLFKGHDFIHTDIKSAVKI